LLKLTKFFCHTRFISLSPLNLILLPLPPREKGCKAKLINDLAPLPRERGWGEVKSQEEVVMVISCDLLSLI